MSEEIDQTVGGDHDTWILFNRETVDGYPLVVLARTGNPMVDVGLRNANVTVIHCEASASIVNEWGMPQGSDLLYPVEEELARELQSAQIGALHIASITGDRERRIVFVHDGPLDFQPLLRSFDVEGYSMRASNDEDRDLLRSQVIPSPLDLQLNGDREVISNIEKHGDDGTEPRNTEFWFYGDKTGLDFVITDLEHWDVSIERRLTDPEGVVLSCNTSVNFETFSKLTPVLVGVAEKRGVTYDGWETLVLKPGGVPDLPSVPKKSISLLSRIFGGRQN